MKQYLLAFAAVLSAHAYAQNPTQGPLQTNPALCGYGYNPNCSPNQSASKPAPDFSRRTDYYAAIAVNAQTGAWGWSTGFFGQEAAQADAVMNCEQSGRGGCRAAAFQRNGCLAMASSPNPTGGANFHFSASGVCGRVEQEALNRCRHSGAASCKLDIRQLNARHQYYLHP
ncbi:MULTISPECIES: DUF4189 domain-containing protein [Eikenella]|uniref:DUF4189 domain-containing protein n=1 Tax=Eikenella longinqua TaxID=1795827 RepID=A0A1A9RZI2_9NEIS|nr:MULTISPECIES: DUF4189 domain-containing protein [Eikenella]OAM29951.1 hypothetical protein A7P95_02685 [Eikenella longinqua]